MVLMMFLENGDSLEESHSLLNDFFSWAAQLRKSSLVKLHMCYVPKYTIVILKYNDCSIIYTTPGRTLAGHT